MTGNAPNNRQVKILMNDDSLSQFQFDYFQFGKIDFANIPANKIKNDTVTFTLLNFAVEPEDEVRVAAIEFTYPRKFNFGGATSFEFELQSSVTGRLIKIANFNKGASVPVLYDLTHLKRYTADTLIKDTLRFFLPPSNDQYQLVLARSDGSTAQSINTGKERKFVNFLDQANQGNYLIISHPQLYGSGSGNYVQQYADYRQSDSGGNHNVKIIDVNELIDQYAYGVDMHPLSIKHFLSYARKHFAEQPKYVFLIGKGITYSNYRFSAGSAITLQTNLVPTFGSPGSDILLSSEGYNNYPEIPIGRLSAVSPAEVGIYLDKIKTYESRQRDTTGSIADRAWMKKVLHLTGATDPDAGYLIDSSMQRYNSIITDTLFGADLYSYSKFANPEAYSSALFDFTKQYNEGAGLLQYFGHSSASNIDFSLDRPSYYTNNGRYPVFIVNGCLAGNIFEYDVNRQSQLSTLSEKFILEPGLGAIGYLSSTNYGVVSYLSNFTEAFYRAMSSSFYGSGVGDILKESISKVLKDTLRTDFYDYMHAQQFNFHGDPALTINSFDLPDYAIDSANMMISPGHINVAADSFTLKLAVHNLGRATGDSVSFRLQRTYPNGTTEDAFNGKIAAVKSKDSLVFRLPVVGNRDKGTTILTAIINESALVPESRNSNNTAQVKVKITADVLIPVSPYNYSIVTTNNITIAASSAAATGAATAYVMELDTTALFNSPLKTSMQKVSSAGLVEFENIVLPQNNTVYYWRVAEDSADRYWNSFSFVYREPGNSGFEQGHFFQHTNSATKGLIWDTATRSLVFDTAYSSVFISHSIYPTSGLVDADFSVAINGSIMAWSACVGSSISFNVMDPRTFKPVPNITFPYGAGPACKPKTEFSFEFSTQSASARKNVMDFLDYFVQSGYYVIARKIYDMGNADWAPTVWASDTLIYGKNNSLYHRLKDQGVLIDSFTYPRTFVFIYKKNDGATFKPVTAYTKGLYDRITLSEIITMNDTVGTVTSPKFGPGAKWNMVKWNGVSNNTFNKANLDIIAIDRNGADSLVSTIDTSVHTFDISAIDAAVYPYIQLRMQTQDSVEASPYQLKNWSVEFEPVPEGALSPNLGSSIPDTLRFFHPVNTQQDSLKGYVVFKNISAASFDPLKVKLVLYDRNDAAYTYAVPDTKALAAGDTVRIDFAANVSALPEGTYNLFLEVNPDNDQPEQYHYNNFLYQYVTILRESALAASFFDLAAKPLNGGVQLQWTVKNESGVVYYEPEFSTDGIQFRSLGRVNVSSAATWDKKYSFLHTIPVIGNNYYRIKMVNQSGLRQYTPVRMVNLQQLFIKVYPNPFKQQLTVTSQNMGTQARLTLLDLTGRVIMQQQFTGSTQLQLAHLSAGLYMVQVNDGHRVVSYKVVKE